MTEQDFKLIEENLLNAIKHEQELNQQILGRLDAYENILKMVLKILIDKATEK